MQKNVHPNYNQQAKITCTSCGQTHVLGSTVDETTVEICSNCHPFYTGQQDVIVDTYSRVDKFKQKQEEANSQAKEVVAKRKKKAQRRSRVKSTKASPKVTLRDMLKQTQSKSS